MTRADNARVRPTCRVSPHPFTLSSPPRLLLLPIRLLALAAAPTLPAPAAKSSPAPLLPRQFLVRAAETDRDGPLQNGAGLWSLYLDEPDPEWAAHVTKFDVVVVSAGSWFYRPSVFYERGRDRKSVV